MTCIRDKFILLRFLAAWPLLAREPVFERFPPEQQQMTGTIHSMIQDRRGFLWLGATNGLFRYDGYEFRAFRHDPADSNSISGDHIWSICEDRRGDLWIGTSGRGLNCYRLGEERFIRYRLNPVDSAAIAGDLEVPWVMEDRDGNIWAALWENGLDRYDAVNRRFIHHPFSFPDEEGQLRSNVHRLYQDRSGRQWVGSKRGLYAFEPPAASAGEAALRIKAYRHDPGDPGSIGGNYIYAILEDHHEQLWVGTLDGGVSRYDPERDTFTVFRHDPADPHSLSSDAVTAMCLDSAGSLWVGTQDAGLNRFDEASRRFERLSASSQMQYNLSSNCVVSLLVDRTGNLWVGTDDGTLHRYNPRQRKFAHFRHDSRQPGSLGASLVNSIYEARDGTLWVGTAGGGLNRFRKETGTFRRYRADDRPGSDFVSAICEDRRGQLWIGTSGAGLYRFDPGSERFRQYRYLPGARDPTVIAQINVLFTDRRGNLWIGTDGDGIACYLTERDSLVHYGADSTSALYNLRHIWAILEDSAGDLWFGVWGRGAAWFQQASGKVLLFNNHSGGRRKLNSNVVISLAEDRQGNIWMGTWGEGLGMYDRRGDSLIHFTTSDGLPNDIVLGILPDGDGNIWISTANGLARYQPASGEWKVFDHRDGLQSHVFRTGAYHKGHSGRLYFGGVNGFNGIEPETIRENPHPPPVVITGFSIFNRQVTSHTPDSPLSRSIEETELIRLSYRDKFFSFSFAALDFSAPEKNRYAYMLENFDLHWNEAGAAHTASYTNLDPGEYRFRVKAANNDGVWNEDGAAVRIIITPPWWKTWWAYTLYLLLAGALLYGLRRYELNRLRLKHQLQVEHLEQEKLRELDHLKSHFFANISHELRTPLSLILAPIENVITRLPEVDLRRQLRLAYRNGQRLQRLINQLLDLSRLDAGALKLNTSRRDLVAFLKGIVFTFESLAQQKNITLGFHSALARLPLSFDAEKLEQVFYNLIINAIKFTPEGGKVIVDFGFRISDLENLDRPAPALSGDPKSAISDFVEITVSDTGAGIPAEFLPRIFDRFFQADIRHSHAPGGAGIGLALAKEFVELHGGRISVTSEPGKGTIFVVVLPLTSVPAETGFDDIPVIEESPGFSESPAETPPAEVPEAESLAGVTSGGEQEVILLVEDNAEVRAFLRMFLAPGYAIIEAEDGRQGLEKAIAAIPDLVISDVMMPGMDGYNFCRALKADQRTSHIPVILLTARAGEDSKLEGLHTGADDYLTKPFNSRELLARVGNLIEQRRRLREKFTRQVVLKPGEIPITSLEEQFLNRVKAAVEVHLGDEAFTVTALCREVGMSRVQLHRKLRALSGLSAGQFMLLLRLQRAADLLKQNAGTVAEIAYTVGFNTPNYFARCFRRQFGCAPAEYRRRGAANQEQR